ncbi:MAG: hypothetical protein AABW91_03010 [Nanoarchaeota archaeon]
MSTIDRVRELKMAGKSDGEIISELQEQGLTPREINDVLSRSKVKDAVFNGGQQEQTEFSQEFGEGMQPSLMNSPRQKAQEYYGQENQSYEGNYARQTQEMSNENYDQSMPQPQEYPGYQNYAGEQQGSQEYPQYNAVNTETMTEIAAQLIDEKVVKITSALKDLTEMKSILDLQVKKVDERLSRIESIIDSLQTSLIRKTSEQEQNIVDIKTELQGMQTGFSKVINPLTDRARETQKTYYKKTSKPNKAK